MLPSHPASDAETAQRDDDASSSDSGGHRPALLRGLGIGGGGGKGEVCCLVDFEAEGREEGQGVMIWDRRSSDC